MAYYSSGLRMNKLQLRKHGTSQCWATEFGLESTQAIWFQPHMVPGGPESSVLLEVQMVTIWKRQDSVTEREPNMLAMFYSWSGDIPDLGTGSAGVPFRRVLHTVCLQSGPFLCAGCTWQKYTYKVTDLFTSEDFWKNGIYCLFNRPLCFYLHLILVISYSHVMQYVSLKEF